MTQERAWFVEWYAEWRTASGNEWHKSVVHDTVHLADAPLSLEDALQAVAHNRVSADTGKYFIYRVRNMRTGQVIFP